MSDTFPLHWPIDSDWSEKLDDFFRCERFQTLQKFLELERNTQTVFPAAENVFRAFSLTSFAETRVVILGQDPYHGPDQAHGLSFSVPNGCPSPPSLKNIFKELVDDLGVAHPENGDLTRWAEQGVLLLNTVLTVRSGAANSHSKRGWEDFTDRVIEILGKQTRNRIVFILWGKPAESKRSLIDATHRLIISPHPSPLSSYRGFFGSKPFSKANEALSEFGKRPIDWRLD